MRGGGDHHRGADINEGDTAMADTADVGELQRRGMLRANAEDGGINTTDSGLLEQFGKWQGDKDAAYALGIRLMVLYYQKMRRAVPNERAAHADRPCLPSMAKNFFLGPPVARVCTRFPPAHPGVAWIAYPLPARTYALDGTRGSPLDCVPAGASSMVGIPILCVCVS